MVNLAVQTGCFGSFSVEGKVVLKKELAEALGISGAMVTELSKRGMPTDSVERAMRWRRRHLEPGRVKATRRDLLPPLPDRGAVAEAVQSSDVPEPDYIAHAALMIDAATGNFERHASALRMAMRCVPEHQRDAVEIPPELWDRLLGRDLLAVLGVGDEGPADGASGPPSGAETSDEDCREFGIILYKLACGEMRLNPDA